jgi:hypothetical protein
MTDLRVRADALLRQPSPFDEWVAGNIFDDFIQRYLKGGPWNYPELINHLGVVLKLAREVADAEKGERQAFMRELAGILDGIHAEVAPLVARVPVDLATRRDVAGWTTQLETGEQTEHDRRTREIEILVNVIQPDPQRQPRILTDRATAFEICDLSERTIRERLEGFFRRPLTIPLSSPLWQIVDTLKAQYPGWPDDWSPDDE